jgi:elongation factor Ts
MDISADLVKQLRERTGAGMMECKKALAATQGDLEAAIEHMRKTGLAKADKRAARTAAEGSIVIAVGEHRQEGVILEVNCETDFVAKGEEFVAFGQKVVAAALAAHLEDLATLGSLPYSEGQSIDEKRRELVAKIGENIQIRRFARFMDTAATIHSYLHGNRIGVLLALVGGDDELGKDIAMHIAAIRPLAIDETGLPEEVVAKEREIILANVAETESKKPAEIQQKIAEGRLKKFFAENTLVGQPFVKDPNQSVGQLLAAKKAKVLNFYRFEVGEGIEKVQTDFREEVMAQVAAAQNK